MVITKIRSNNLIYGDVTTRQIQLGKKAHVVPWLRQLRFVDVLEASADESWYSEP